MIHKVTRYNRIIQEIFSYLCPVRFVERNFPPMTHTPKISVLVPVYKVSAFIERCVHSLFSQTFEDMEYIFVDDATPDDSIGKLEAVAALYPERRDAVRIIRHPYNKGIYAARRTAFEAAKGIFCMSVDSDDYAEPDMAELMYAEAVRTGADIVYSNYYEETAEGKRFERKVFFSEDKKEAVADVLFASSALWNKLVKRSLIDKTTLSDLENVSMGDDLAFSAKFVYYADKYARVDKSLYHYVRYNTSSITATFSRKNAEDMVAVIKNLEVFFSSRPDGAEYEEVLKRFKALKKIRILRGTSASRKYMGLYPELKPLIRKMDLPLKSEIILMLAAYKCRFVLIVFLFVLRCLNYIKNLRVKNYCLFIPLFLFS